MYVTALNCSKSAAYEQMTAVKRKYGERGKVVAYHGYQSFAAGEVTPDEAHRIGVETARRMAASFAIKSVLSIPKTRRSFRRPRGSGRVRSSLRSGGGRILFHRGGTNDFTLAFIILVVYNDIDE